jgi:hypothetical protein
MTPIPKSPDELSAPAWPAGCAAEVLVLRFDGTPTERTVVDEWIERACPDGVAVESRSGEELAGSAVSLPTGRRSRPSSSTGPIRRRRASN